MVRAYAIAAVGLLLLSPLASGAPAARHDPYTPRFLRIYVADDAMVRLTGADIAEAIDHCNALDAWDYVSGEELLETPGAARTGDLDTDDAGGFSAIEGQRTSVVGPNDPDLPAGGGEHCIRIDASPEHSEIRNYYSRFSLPGGQRYLFSCRVLSGAQDRTFRIGVLSDLAGHMAATPLEGRSYAHAPGEWKELSGALALPDMGRDHEVQVWIHHTEKQAGPWYLDGVSVRRLDRVRTRVPYREKSPAEAAFDPYTLDVERLGLYRGERSVPLETEQIGQDGRLRPETTLAFWGERPREADGRLHRFASQTVYTLRWDLAEPPARMAAVPAPDAANQGETVETYSRVRRVERDQYVDREVFRGAPSDHTVWKRFWAPPARQGHTVVLPPLRDLAPGAVPTLIRAALWGRTDVEGSPDHDWVMEVNGQPVAQADWDGRTLQVIESNTAGRLLRRTRENVVEFVRAPVAQPGGALIDGVALDWIELTYEASLTPEADALEYAAPRGADASRASLRAGFSGSPVHVYDNALGQSYALLEQAGRLIHQVPAGASVFRAVGPTGYVKPDRIEVGYAAQLPSPVSPPEYLVITHRWFEPALQPLLSLRKSQGLTVGIVRIEDILDAFGEGLFDPHALYAFLDAILSSAPENSERLRYVLLVGAAHFDYRGIYGGAPNLVPTWHAERGALSEYLALVADDSALAVDDGGAGLPEAGGTPRAAVGRLPVSRPEDVQAYVEKVVAYERAETEASSEWTGTVLLIDGWGFEGYTEHLRSVAFPEWDAAVVSAAAFRGREAELPKEVVAAVNHGCGVINFVGHGGNYVWRTSETPTGAVGDIFTGRDLAALRNADRYPIVFTSTCYSALFDEPSPTAYTGPEGIGVSLVLANRKGAAALVGHVGKSSVADAHAFNTCVMELLYRQKTERLGDAFLLARQRFPYPQQQGMALIGDPALRVHRPR